MAAPNPGPAGPNDPRLLRAAEEYLAALEAGCEKAIQSPAYRDWAQWANQVVDFKPSSAFDARLRQDSQSKATTLKRLGL